MGGAAAAAVCSVCLSADDYHGSELVRCAGCALQVHVRCYGRSVSADLSAWRCEPCGLSPAPPVPPQCAVCPVAGGALRLTSQRDVWCHVRCVNWIPELSHSLAGELDEQVDIALLDASRDALRCLVCGQRGGCIQCISGRCARSFHVSCAFRAPSALIFTGYNEANQQVYHCKTHLSDVSSRRFEMVDDSWRALDAVKERERAHPLVPGRCRYCTTKLTPGNQDVHEDQCMLAWLAREDVQRRKLLLTRHGITPPTISRTKKSTSGKQRGKSDRRDDAQRSSSSGKARRQNGSSTIPVRPCPECGEHIRETLMMGHLRNNCPKTKHATHGKWKRKHTDLPMVTGAGEAASADREALLGSDLTDVLFDSWPGQNAGAPMNAAHLWKVVDRNFFSSKAMVKKRMDQLCKSLCGAKLDDVSNFRRRPAATDLDCRDAVLFEYGTREDPSCASLSYKTSVHRCDFMMRASRTHCVSDVSADPCIEIIPRSSASAGVPEHAVLQDLAQENGEDSSKNQALALSGDIRVAFQNVNEDKLAASCKFLLRLSGKEAIDQVDQVDQERGVWSTFLHDAHSTMVGPLAKLKLPLSPINNLLISMTSLDDGPHTNGLETLSTNHNFEKGDINQSVNLLADHLNEQMQTNRRELRGLVKKLEAVEYNYNKFQNVAAITEMYYKEHAAWKQLCKSLVIGYRGTKALAAVMSGLSGTGEAEASNPTNHDDQEDEEEPIDDGTCVVCFDGQSPESNPIVFCDRCELAVHQRCYGIVKVPSNEFICDRCKIEREGQDPATSVFCQLCSLGDGAFKRTIDGKWVHVVCALWCPKVWIGNLLELSDINLVGPSANSGPRFRDTTSEVQALIAASATNGVSSLKKIPTDKEEESDSSLCQGNLCMYCRVACGRTIQCCHSGCSVSFHPLCGWFEGLPMTIGLNESGFIYGGGGAGLKFQLLCKNHLPTDYSDAERLIQRQRRRKVRIDAFFVYKTKSSRFNHSRIPSDAGSSLLSGSIVQAIIAAEDSAKQDVKEVDPGRPDWTDMTMCSACFEFVVPTVGPLSDVNMLHRRQFMMRCQYCNIYIHPECCISEIGPSATIFRSNWICECCIQLGDKRAREGCITCGISSDYLMPCATNPTNSSNGTLALGGKTPPKVSESRKDVHNDILLLQNTAMGAQLVQASRGPNGSQHQHSGNKSSPRSNGEHALTFDKWIHVYCCKWKKAKVVKRHHVQHAHAPPPTPASTPNSLLATVARCDVCSRRSGELVSCAQCQKRFHPLCAAKKKRFCARSSRSDWKFYCDAHAPSDAVFDIKRQSWMTREILNQLIDLRQSLERGRMLLEMSRQRDRQQKRLLNVAEVPLMTASVDIVVKKRPSALMREVYHSMTGDTLKDTPRRPKPQPTTPVRPNRRTSSRRAGGVNADADEGADAEQTPHRTSARLAATPSSASKRTRGSTGVEEVASGSRPKRRRLEIEMEDVSDSPARPTRSSGRRASPRNEEDHATLKAQKLFFEDTSLEDVEQDFDDIVPEMFPEMIDM